MQYLRLWVLAKVDRVMSRKEVAKNNKDKAQLGMLKRNAPQVSYNLLMLLLAYLSLHSIRQGCCKEQYRREARSNEAEKRYYWK